MVLSSPVETTWIKLLIDNFMQIVIWFIIPATRNQRANHNNNALALIVLIQYVPRLYLIFPLSSQIIKATGLVTKTAWAGAAYNLLLYMLASHVSISLLHVYILTAYNFSLQTDLQLFNKIMLLSMLIGLVF